MGQQVKCQDQMASIIARINRHSQAIDKDSSMDQIPTQLRLSWKDNIKWLFFAPKEKTNEDWILCYLQGLYVN